MAISDLMISLFTVFYIIISLMHVTSAIAGSVYQFLCQWNFHGFAASFTISALSSTTIIIDRYMIIINENSKKSIFSKPMNLGLSIMAIWSVGFAVSASSYLSIYENITNNHACDIKSFQQDSTALSVFRLFVTILVFPLPLVIATSLYYHAIKKICQH